MHLVRVAAAALNQTPLDWDGNQARILEAIRLARQQGVAVLVLPELCIPGYGCEDAFFGRGTILESWRVLQELLPETQGIVVALGLPIMHRAANYNAVCLVADGHIVGLVGKRFLAGDGIHYEPRWFKGWPAGKFVQWEHDGHSYPLGDQIFEVGGLRIGFEICEDAWVPNRPGVELASQGVDFICNPSASHFAFGKHEVRKQIVLNASRSFRATYVYSNFIGNESGRVIYDGECMIASIGHLIAEGPRLGYDDVYLTSAVVDVDLARMLHARTTYAPTVDDNVRRITRFDMKLPGADLPPHTVDPDDELRNDKREEFSRAVALGLFDYLRKSRSRGFVVSLSGGADSAAVAYLVHVMVMLAVQELGVEATCARLGLPEGVCTTPRAIVRSLLTCVYQSTANSSDTTRNAAAAVAEAVGAEFIEFDVDPLVRTYVSNVEAAIGRELSWQRDDIALQNIQARARAPGVWLLANLRGALLLATSNRSEAAVGYATMDGDTCGGLSPIAGIDKAFLREWLRWVEAEGPAGVGPMPALRAVNVQAPTAELRPSGAHQTDEGDLMPYPILDAIERAAIRDKLAPKEVYRVLASRFPQRSRDQLLLWVKRFFRLWSQNQWKRERYAPSFHLDDENLDPKTWCRFPILSGGFAHELAELEAFVKHDDD
ncbi:NAD(+) synthase [Nannocystis pusilla]|uniref:Glutamine-dependent NAD(+) synthetase n=1 Tax=Nannocystis pusilla TaxID=889268 RepID=A0ABS7U0T6_9BACT|nr:NAD(+) synthase [Nannocystis pusilla]MBZ5714127.1 NAD(+) synthase [Nannocystis pusilla]